MLGAVGVGKPGSLSQQLDDFLAFWMDLFWCLFIVLKGLRLSSDWGTPSHPWDFSVAKKPSSYQG